MDDHEKSDDITQHQFVFHGTGRQYFGIWIVNILLSIVTIGIYSAWAKVRTRRYFNGNTELAGHQFDYHANPVSILKGRIVVVLVLIVLNLLSQIHPLIGVAVILVYALVLPWVIVRGLQFNANMTSYRNVRFHFSGTKIGAAKAYILLPLIAIVSLGALIPFVSRSNARFLGNGYSFGQSRFSANPPLGGYYRGLIFAFITGLFAIAAAVVLAVVSLTTGPDGDLFGPSVVAVLSLAIIPLYLLLISAVLTYAAVSRNIGFNNLRLQDGHQFSSTVGRRRYVWIIISNGFLTIVTLGLYIPWAKVRLARYLADNTFMLANGGLDQFVSGQVDASGVTSGEFLDIEGFDFGF